MTGALRVLEHNLIVYRRTWKGSVFMSFVSPVLFLAAMGIGLGSLISRGPVRTVDGLSYLAFLAPGLLVATAMQSGYVETTFPIMARIQWERTYEGMLATPLRVLDVLAGEFGWLALRLGLGSVAFFIVMLLFGTVHSELGILAIVVSILTGLAFAAPILAWTATQRTTTSFSLIGRFLITPLFLLGGVFFPIHQLPQLVQGIAWLTPLAHGVTLARSLSVGVLPSSAGIHLAVLLLYASAGIVAAWITLKRRLVAWSPRCRGAGRSSSPRPTARFASSNGMRSSTGADGFYSFRVLSNHSSTCSRSGLESAPWSAAPSLLTAISCVMRCSSRPRRSRPRRCTARFSNQRSISSSS